jgi:hypothetical protein
MTGKLISTQLSTLRARDREAFQTFMHWRLDEAAPDEHLSALQEALPRELKSDKRHDATYDKRLALRFLGCGEGFNTYPL